MSEKNKDLLVSSGRPARKEARHVNLPIELGSTMVFDTMDAFEAARDNRYQSGTMFYGRYGNEASYQLENVLAELEGAAGVTLTSSGVAAISLTLQSLVNPGDHLLVADNVYGNTRAFCERVLPAQQVDVEFFDAATGAQVSELFRSNTAAVMFEAPGTGTFEFPDIQGIATAAREASVVSVLDGTWATAIFCQPLALGVDVLVYSGSKYICGHSDCMFGVIASAQQQHHDDIRHSVMSYGDKIGSHEVFLALRGLRTLELRMQTVNQSGLTIAKWFAQQPQVLQVLHPALPDCPGHEYWKQYCSGSAGLFGVVFTPVSDERINRFVEALHHFGIGVSWGGYESLVLPVKPVRTATQWQHQGQLVRFNIGFESTESLIEDIQSAITLLS
ncbi:MAG: cystathionine beta-lyase [Pseudomonadota bacterium]